MILVQGGAGHAGFHIVKALCNGLKGNENYKVIAGYTEYHAKNLPKIKELGVECVKFDLNEPNTMDQALKGITCVVIIPPYLPTRESLCNRFIDKCVNFGIKHVFLISVAGAGARAFPLARELNDIENKLMSTTMKYTIIRSAFYQESTLMQKKAIQEGSFFLSTGDAKIPLVCICDIGDLICKVTLNPSLGSNKILEITGPENLNGTEMAKIFTEKLGKPVNFVSISKDQCKEKLKGCGFSNEFKVDNIGELLAWYAKGNGRISNEFSLLTGKEATTFEKFVEMKKDEIIMA